MPTQKEEMSKGFKIYLSICAVFVIICAVVDITRGILSK